MSLTQSFDNNPEHHVRPDWKPSQDLTARLRLIAELAERRGGWNTNPVLWVLSQPEDTPEEILLKNGQKRLGPRISCCIPAELKEPIASPLFGHQKRSFVAGRRFELKQWNLD